MKRLLLLLLLSVCAAAQTVNQDLLPASTGLNLGHTNQRWNANIRNLDISGTCSINGNPVPCVGGPALPNGCTNGQIPSWNGTVWICASAGSGTVTSVGSGTGLTGGPVTNVGSLSISPSFQMPQGCSNGQAPQWNGSSWVCANAGSGTVTSITTSSSGTTNGLTGGTITNTGNLSWPMTAASKPGFPLFQQFSSGGTPAFGASIANVYVSQDPQVAAGTFTGCRAVNYVANNDIVLPGQNLVDDIAGSSGNTNGGEKPCWEQFPPIGFQNTFVMAPGRYFLSSLTETITGCSIVSSNVVCSVSNAGSQNFISGDSGVTIAGLTPSACNGTYQLTAANTTSISYANPGGSCTGSITVSSASATEDGQLLLQANMHVRGSGEGITSNTSSSNKGSILQLCNSANSGTSGSNPSTNCPSNARSSASLEGGQRVVCASGDPGGGCDTGFGIFHVSIENVQLSCNDISGGVGLDNTNAQENFLASGLSIKQCLNHGAMVIASSNNGSGSRDSVYDRLNLRDDSTSSVCTTDSFAIDLPGGSCPDSIRNVTINVNGCDTGAVYPNYLVNAQCNDGSLYDFHMERKGIAGVDVRGDGITFGGHWNGCCTLSAGSEMFQIENTAQMITIDNDSSGAPNTDTWLIKDNISGHRSIPVAGNNRISWQIDQNQNLTRDTSGLNPLYIAGGSAPTSINSTPIARPGSPALSQGGTPGSTSYSYSITCRDQNGVNTQGSSTATTATGASTLNGTNYNILTITYTQGCQVYAIYRTASSGTPSTTGLIGTLDAGTAPLVFNDQGAAGDGTTIVTVNDTGDVDLNTSSIDTSVANCSTSCSHGGTGTLLHKVAVLTSANPSTVTLAATTDTTGAVGIVIGNYGTTGSATIARDGQAACIFDGATTAGDYVQMSSSTAGDCHDAGSMTWPTSGQVLGQVLSTNASGGLYRMTVIPDSVASTGGGGSGTINNASQYSGAYYSAAGSNNTISGSAAPTSPSNVPQYWTSKNSGGSAAAPTWTPSNVPTNAQVGTTYTVAATDLDSYLSFNNAGSIAVTLPVASSFTSNFYFTACDIGVGTATITPTTSTISKSDGVSYGSGGTSLALTTGQCAFIYSDNTNYFAVVSDGNASQINGGAFTGVNGDLIAFGAGNTSADSGIVAANVVTAPSNFASNRIVLGGGSNKTTKAVAGIATDGTSVVILGVSGTSAGGVQMTNATSGSVTISPVTGALGSVTASLPANTGTLAELNLAQTWTALQTFGSNASIASTAHGPLISENTSAVVAAGAGTAGQAFTSGGASADPAFSDIWLPQYIPAANCNNTTAGAGWSIPSGGTVTCRAGTNNLGGFITITDTSSTFAQFTTVIPFDWDTSSRPYIRVYFASASDTTNGHTVIPQVKVSCSQAANGTTSDDATFSAAQSLSTTTFGASAVANGFYSGSNVQFGSTQMSGCVAGGLFIVQIGRATDTATGNINFYGASITWPHAAPGTAQAN